MAANQINTTRKRRALKPRHTPYWAPVRRGVNVGFHKGETDGTWRARVTGSDGKYRYQVLGGEHDMDFDCAADLAMKFADQASKALRPDLTVRDAAADYVADLRTRKGEPSATGVEQRIARHVLPALGDTRVMDLRTQHVKRWRDSLVRQSDNLEDVRKSRDGANRLLAILKAALNLAFRSGLAPSDGEWRRVPTFRGVGAARKLFLTPDQVGDLLKATDGAFGQLIEAAVLTGARYGELCKAKVGDLDAKGGTLHLDGKTGARECYLGADALKFFRSLSLGKLPEAPLLMKEDGSHWKKSQQHRLMQRSVKAAHLPAECVFYSLRHYHISRALLAGIPAQVVAENCGTSIRMIEKHYGKFLKADRRAMMDKVAL